MRKELTRPGRKRGVNGISESRRENSISFEDEVLKVSQIRVCRV